MQYFNKQTIALSQLDGNLRWQLSNAKGNYLKVSNKKMCRIRQQIAKFCDDYKEVLTNTALDMLAPNKEISEIMEYLSKVTQEHSNSINRAKEDAQSVISDFDGRIKDALDTLITMDAADEFSRRLITKGGKTSYSAYNEDSFLINLEFEDATFSGDFESDFYFSECALSKNEDGYCLELIGQLDEPLQCFLTFRMIKLEIVCFNYANSYNPYSFELWRMLGHSLTAMNVKSEILGSNYLNASELELLPLCSLAPLMQNYGFYNPDVSKESADLFCSFAKAADLQQAAKLIDHFPNSNDKQKKKISKRFETILKSKESEPLFRLLLKKIQVAAGEYPTKVQYELDEDEVQKERVKITELLYANGFEGEYPAFRKRSEYRGLHFVNTNSDTQFLWNEKNMASYINCVEGVINHELQICFYAGTIFLKKDQLDYFEVNDAFSCSFKDKDRRRGMCITPNIMFSYDAELQNYEKMTRIAIKVSQCQKLTKQERKEQIIGAGGPFGAIFCALLGIFSGLLFAVIMCLGMLLLVGVIGLVVTFSFTQTLDLIYSLPWTPLFWFCAIGFGLPMFIASYISSKKG